jgi:hypothetical protein
LGKAARLLWDQIFSSDQGVPMRFPTFTKSLYRAATKNYRQKTGDSQDPISILIQHLLKS